MDRGDALAAPGLGGWCSGSRGDRGRTACGSTSATWEESVRVPGEPTTLSRPATHLLYFVLEPWLGVGGTLGAGVDLSTRRGTLVAGLWEGFPTRSIPGCARADLTYGLVTVALGWRWAGAHELYLTVKGGVARGGGICWS